MMDKKDELSVEEKARRYDEIAEAMTQLEKDSEACRRLGLVSSYDASAIVMDEHNALEKIAGIINGE